jgi:hypothetical protein
MPPATGHTNAALVHKKPRFGALQLDKERCQ